MSDFFNWLENRERNVKPEFEEMETLWNASRVSMPPAPDKDAMWNDLRARMAQAEHVAQKPPWYAFFMQPAFAMAAVLVIFLALYMFNLNGPSYTAERGTRGKLVQLQDQSTVTLNAGSSLVLSKSFNKKDRQVALDGEAFFEVQKGAEPFVIKAGEATVRVVGTKFNVSTWGNAVRLHVTEGIVEFSAERNGKVQMVTLRAGESSYVLRGEGPQEPQPVNGKTDKPDWMNDKISYEDVPFVEICKQIERRFNITIKIVKPELASAQVSGVLVTKKVEETLEALVSSVNCNLRVDNGVYFIE